MSITPDFPPPPPPPPQRSRRWLWVSLAAGAAALVIIAGSLVAVPKLLSTAPAAAAAPVTVTASPMTVPTRVTTTATVSAPAKTVTTMTASTIVTATVPPATVTITPTAAAAPNGAPQDGMNAVGGPGGVQPATYGSGKSGCSWQRQSSTSDDSHDVLSYGSNSGGEVTTVTIMATDVAFKSVGCAPWFVIN